MVREIISPKHISRLQLLFVSSYFSDRDVPKLLRLTFYSYF